MDNRSFLHAYIDIYRNIICIAFPVVIVSRFFLLCVLCWMVVNGTQPIEFNLKFHLIKLLLFTCIYYYIWIWKQSSFFICHLILCLDECGHHSTSDHFAFGFIVFKTYYTQRKIDEESVFLFLSAFQWKMKENRMKWGRNIEHHGRRRGKCEGFEHFIKCI